MSPWLELFIIFLLSTISEDFTFIHDAFLMHAGTNPMYYSDKDPTSDFAFVKDVLFERLSNEYKYKLFMPVRDLDLTEGKVRYPNLASSSSRAWKRPAQSIW